MLQPPNKKKTATLPDISDMFPVGGKSNNGSSTPSAVRKTASFPSLVDDPDFKKKVDSEEFPGERLTIYPESGIGSTNGSDTTKIDERTGEPEPKDTPFSFFKKDIKNSQNFFGKQDFTFKGLTEPTLPVSTPLQSDEEAKRQSDEIMSNPDKFRKYVSARINTLKSDISNAENNLSAKNVSYPDVQLGIPSLRRVIKDTDDPEVKAIEEKKKYLNELKKKALELSRVIVPAKRDLSNVTDSEIESIGEQTLRTANVLGISDDRKVLDQLEPDKDLQTYESISNRIGDDNAAKLYTKGFSTYADDARRTMQSVKYKFYKEGANALTSFYANAANEAFGVAKPKLELLSSLSNEFSSAKDSEKPEYKRRIVELMNDPDIVAFAGAQDKAILWREKYDDAINKFPQAKRKELRQQIFDTYFDILRNREKVAMITPDGSWKVLGHWLFGEEARKEDAGVIAKKLGIDKKEVEDIIQSNIKGFFGGSESAGIRVEGLVPGIAKSFDEMAAGMVKGVRRLFDVQNVDAKNRMLSDRLEDYNMMAEKAKLFDDAGNVNFNPYSVFNTMGRGIGQTALYALPSMVTGGLATGISGAEGVGKLVSVLTTASSAIGSFEDGYVEAGRFTDDEDKRRGYGLLKWLSEGLSESILEPAEIAKKIGVKGKKMSFSDFSKMFDEKGVGGAVFEGLKDGLKVIGVEEFEEMSSLVSGKIGDKLILGKESSWGEIMDDVVQTMVTTAITTLPLGIGAGISAGRDVSGIRKESLFEVGNEPDEYKPMLKKMLDEGKIDQDQYNERISVINEMARIVPAIGDTDKNGKKLSYDQKVALAAEQFRIDNNKRLLKKSVISAEVPVIEQDIKEAEKNQAEIINGTQQPPTTTETVSEPLQTDEGKSEKQGTETAVSEGVNQSGQGDAEAAAPVLSEDNISVGEMIDKTGSYKGDRGSFYLDGKTVVFKPESKNIEYELGNVDEIKDAPIGDFGIEHEESVVSISDDGSINVRGKNYVNRYSNPSAAINRDAEGRVISVNLETDKGEKRTFKGNVADDIAFQILYKPINENDETRSEFEQFINEDESAAKEMESSRLPEPTEEKPVGDVVEVPREKIERVEQPTTTKQLGQTEDLGSRVKLKLGTQVSAGTNEDALNYAIDKVAEAPTETREQLGDELFNEVLELTPTEKLKSGLDFLIENDSDSPNVKVLDDIISEREKKQEDKAERKEENKGEEKAGKQKVTVSNIKVGDEVKWLSQGVDQFETPRKVTSISEDGTHVFVEGSNTGIPIEQVEKQAAKSHEQPPKGARDKEGNVPPKRNPKITTIQQLEDELKGIFALDSMSKGAGNLLNNIKKIANAIKAGTSIFKRFSQAEQRGFTEGGTANVEASLLLAANERASGKDNATPEAQENVIEQYAKENGIWVENTTDNLTQQYGDPIAAGEEAIVWGDPETGKVIKTQNTFQYGNLQQKLDAITLHNTYFPEAALRVVGFGRNAAGDFQVIVEQPFIQGNKLTRAEISEYLSKIGFKEDENGNFSNGDTIIEDVHTGNAIKDDLGNIIVIDPIVRLNTPEQGYGGSRKIDNSVDSDSLGKGRTGQKDSTIYQYIKKAKAVLNKLYPDATITIYDNSDEYYEKEKRPIGSLGVFHPTEKRLALNLELILEHGEEGTIFHEVIHPIVNSAIVNNKKDLADIWDRIQEFKDIPGMDAVFAHARMYAGRGLDIQRVEGITEFLTQVVEGNIDIDNIPDAKAKNKFIELVKGLLKAIGINIPENFDIKSFASSIKEAFDTGNVSGVRSFFNEKDRADSIQKTLQSVWGLNEQQSKDVYSIISAISDGLKRLGINDNFLDNLLIGEGRVSDKALKQIIGEVGAENLPKIKDNLQVARDMEAAGKSPKEIWLATGWERTKDNNKWKYDLPDGKLKSLKDIKTENRLKDIYDNKELYEAYPELKDALVTIDPLVGSLGNHKVDFDTDLGRDISFIAINDSLIDNEGQFKSTLIHEIQHAIQDIEGFARGGSPENAKAVKDALFKKEIEPFLSEDDNLLNEFNELKKIWENGKITESQTKRAEQIRKRRDELEEIVWGKLRRNGFRQDEREKFDLYKRLAGEVEARNAQIRAEMTPEQRREQMLSETEDVSEDSKIYIYGANEVANSVEHPEIEQELADIKTKAIADGTFMKAPNGKPTNLNERQWLNVRTKAFRKWSNNWKNVIKINEEPVVLYHGGISEIHNIEHTPFWLAIDPQKASEYADRASFRETGMEEYDDVEIDEYVPEYFDTEENGQNVLPVFVRFNKLLDLREFGQVVTLEKIAAKLFDIGIIEKLSDEDILDIADEIYIGEIRVTPKTNVSIFQALEALDAYQDIAKHGFDVVAIIDNDIRGDKMESVAILRDSGNVKSAISNVGTYSGETGNILHQEANAQFRVSSSERIIETLKSVSKGETTSDKATTSILHELYHTVLFDAIESAKQGNKSANGIVDTILSEVEKQTGKKVDKDGLFAEQENFKGEVPTGDNYRLVQEFFAEASELYHKEGATGFSKGFQKVLDAIKEIFQKVYDAISIGQLDVKLTPELRKVFDTILGKDATSKSLSSTSFDALSEKEQEKAVRDLIERAASLDQSKVRDAVKKYTGWSDEKINEFFGERETGIKHEKTIETAREFGFEEYKKDAPQTIEQWDAEAERLIRDGYNVTTLIEKLESGKYIPSSVEQRIMAKYLSNLEFQIEKNPNSELIEKLIRAIKASDVAGGRETARSLVARKGVGVRSDSLSGFFVEQSEANLGRDISEQQEKINIEEYNAIKEAENKLKEKIESLERENSRLMAEKEISKLKKSTPKVNKTHSDFVEERKVILDRIKDKLKNARTGKGGLTAVPVPYVKEIVEIAPDVIFLAKSLLEEGITSLPDIVKNIHSSLKDVFSELTEKDIHDIIAGEYNEKKKSKNELLIRLRELRTEAKLVNKLEELNSGKEPVSDKKKKERNENIDKLRKQIKEHDVTKLANYKKRIKDQIKKIRADLDTGNYQEPKNIKPKLKLDEDAKILRDNLMELKRKRAVRLAKERYDQRSKMEKFKDRILELANVPRTIMSSMDYSAPLRQAVIPTITHPTLAMKAGLEMFKMSFSEKRFDRWFFDLKESNRYELMKDSGLYIADPSDTRLASKEEAFMNNLAEKIPFVGSSVKLGKGVSIPGTGIKIKSVGGFIKGSERAYVGYLNKMRVDLFNRMADAFEDSGIFYNENPELYKGLASWVNNSTGRGGLGNKLENASPILNSVFFSPRLIASRFNILGLSDVLKLGNGFYGNLPKEIRREAAKDMAKFVGAGIVFLSLLAYGLGGDDDDGLSIGLDPRSTDFGKIIYGNTRWDIWGGFQQYARLIAQIASRKKVSTTGKIYELDGDGVFGESIGKSVSRFTRGKLAPVPSMIVDFSYGRNIIGEKVTVEKQLKEHFAPLVYRDLEDAVMDKGVSALFLVGIPSVFGVGVQMYNPRGYENVDRKKGIYKVLFDKNINLTEVGKGNMTDSQFEKFEPIRKGIFETEWNNIINHGAMLNSEGYPTIDSNKGVAIKEFEQLTRDELNSIMKSISNRSSRIAKKRIGYEENREIKNKELLKR